MRESSKHGDRPALSPASSPGPASFGGKYSRERDGREEETDTEDTRDDSPFTPWVWALPLAGDTDFKKTGTGVSVGVFDWLGGPYLMEK